MSAKVKPGATKIKKFISSLKKAPWLGSARRWWPDYLFHVTDIQNAVAILREGVLLSRHGAIRQGLMVTDNASGEIIAQTESRWKDYVRLYFRPRTPTHYQSEGFRPPGQRVYEAHCPVPICLLFDSYSVLAQVGSLFSNGNLAADADVFEATDDLEQLPFDRIYHDSWFGPENRGTIVFHRNAEVAVPAQLGLGALRFVGCRSQAEYESFLHLLPPRAQMRWADKIGLAPRMHLFNKRWTFVESAELGSTKVVLQFSRHSLTPGPFSAKVSITDTISEKRFAWVDQCYEADGLLEVSLCDIGPLTDFSIRLSLDGQLAYAGRYQETDNLPW